jgi:hypothetical protein
LFILQRLNLFSNNRNVEAIFVILVKFKIRNDIKHRFKKQQLNKRIRDAIVHILN